MILSIRMMLALLMLSTLCSISTGQDEVVAKVGDWEITQKRVDRHLKNTIGNRELAAEQLAKARKVALDHLVSRQVVFEFVKKSCPVPDSEVTSELSILETNLAKVDQKLEDHLKKTSLSLEELKQEIRWRVSWQTYLNKKITEEAIATYFKRNRRIFDGTEMRVAHLVIDKQDDAKQQTQKAAELQKQIGAGKMSWADAVNANSIATSSKDKAGEIGWIRYREPMPDVFSNAAFKLDQGQISPPVETAIGIHLIKCLEIKPGKIGAEDVRDELRAHMTRFLFDRIARRHRDDVEVVYPGAKE